MWFCDLYLLTYSMPHIERRGPVFFGLFIIFLLRSGIGQCNCRFKKNRMAPLLGNSKRKTESFEKEAEDGLAKRGQSLSVSHHLVQSGLLRFFYYVECYYSFGNNSRAYLAPTLMAM